MASGFHRSTRLQQNDNTPNHYETLGLEPNASPTDIKKQFYTLSKKHHPDLHPTDPDASSRFTAINIAYHTLSNPSSRAKYDASLFPASASSHSGSYSSASNPAGARPATGLSKRRGVFRGPPPSFYRSGGWGRYSEKRSRHQAQGSSDTSSSSSAKDSSQSTFAGSEGGGYNASSGAFSPGQGEYENDVPHFDREGHYRTQKNVQGRRDRARWKRPVDEFGREIEVEGTGGSLLGSFVILTAMVGGIVIGGQLLFGRMGRGEGKVEDGGRRKREG
ncbi:MAG: hypothetical protein M1820_004271 [Bogoriella megaspora]|nr:MAG: hypothetical protein M1820_004271 [Bogoriella megaspora]